MGALTSEHKAPAEGRSDTEGGGEKKPEGSMNSVKTGWVETIQSRLKSKGGRTKLKLFFKKGGIGRVRCPRGSRGGGGSMGRKSFQGGFP